ncbi:hypothetical protein IV203_000084 (plastid) [Nitzschia inconspicua]|uniref:Uncharacterized protein n=1 Tax=Nitzschia inconspicua TaxID=303405 RepID=A0A8H2SI98_9STRA|nr:hypothetical protein IV203_000014 [Nitzschia inconspicua]QXE46158.1 hypothetical protein IV203_000084 [Nitzschia inconspicua]
MVRELIKTTCDIARGLNATVWGGVEGAEKTAKILKTGLSGADVVIGTSHALEDAACGDYICTTIDVIGSVSSAAGMVLGNIPTTTHLTVVTGSVTVCCRTIRWYCKNYGTFWGCIAAGGDGLKAGGKFIINKLT